MVEQITDGWYYVRVEDDPPYTIVFVHKGYVYWRARTLPDSLDEIDHTRFIARVPNPPQES